MNRAPWPVTTVKIASGDSMSTVVSTVYLPLRAIYFPIGIDGSSIRFWGAAPIVDDPARLPEPSEFGPIANIDGSIASCKIVPGYWMDLRYVLADWAFLRLEAVDASLTTPVEQGSDTTLTLVVGRDLVA